VVVTPSTAVRTTVEQARPFIAKEAVLLSCTKGIEHGTGMRMTQIMAEVCPEHTVAVLSGPNLAVEVSRDLPTATVLGCEQTESAEELQQYLGSARFPDLLERRNDGHRTRRRVEECLRDRGRRE
jgi:glycerol-3-phosphate dehydrogenase (NAD(P)+)